MPKDLLTELIGLFAVSGHESSVRFFVQKHIKRYVDSVSVDKMGNLIAYKKGTGPKVMLSAHMDEIGLMVSNIDDRGLIYVTAVGGIDPAAFVGSQVHVQARKGKLHGFLSTLDLAVGNYIEKIPKMEDIFVDTGLTKDQLKKLGVQIGNYIYLDSHTCCEGEQGIVLGKALDNRIGCYILLELAKRLKKSKTETYFVFTVQEEIGLYGAKTSAFTIEPDWGIVVDTTWANDISDVPSRVVGGGPCIVVKDGEFISNPCITGWLKARAKKKRIKIQLEATEEGTTDAAIIQTSRGGIPTAVISIPVRNIHTQAGIASMKDVNDSISLLEELLKKPPHKCIV